MSKCNLKTSKWCLNFGKPLYIGVEFQHPRVTGHFILIIILLQFEVFKVTDHILQGLLLKTLYSLFLGHMYFYFGKILSNKIISTFQVTGLYSAVIASSFYFCDLYSAVIIQKCCHELVFIVQFTGFAAAFLCGSSIYANLNFN